MARYLTAEQIQRLAFPGRSPQAMDERLRKLRAGERRKRRSEDEDKTEEEPMPQGGPTESPQGDQVAYLKRLAFPGVVGERWSYVYGLTTQGYRLAELKLGQAVEVPERDVDPKYLHHHTRNNDLFVALVEAGGRRVRSLRKDAKGQAWGHYLPRTEDFRWIASKGIRLPWRDYNERDGRTEERQVRPDAVLELVKLKRRLFVEYETGSNSVSSDNPADAGSSDHKLDRYSAFTRGLADVVARKTHYQAAYPDDWAAEVVFVVESQARKENLLAMYETWKVKQPRPLRVRVYTRIEAQTELAREVFGEEGVQRLRAAEAAAQAQGADEDEAVIEVMSAPTGQALGGLRGRITDEQLLDLARVARDAMSRISQTKKAIKRHNESNPGQAALAVPEYPAGYEKLAPILERLGVEISSGPTTASGARSVGGRGASGIK